MAVTKRNALVFLFFIFYIEKWYLFDDENIIKITEKDLLAKEAYLLFYQFVQSEF